MSHVEGGTSPIGGDVVRIHKRGITAIGRIVDGVAVGVCEAQRQIAHGALRRDLQRVVDGVGLVLQLRNIAEAWVSGAERVWIVPACDPQIWQRRSRYWSPVAQRGRSGETVGVGCKVRAIGSPNWGSCRVRIC